LQSAPTTRDALKSIIGIDFDQTTKREKSRFLKKKLAKSRISCVIVARFSSNQRWPFRETELKTKSLINAFENQMAFFTRHCGKVIKLSFVSGKRNALMRGNILDESTVSNNLGHSRNITSETFTGMKVRSSGKLSAKAT